jgi:hypothetical protein
VLAIVGEVNSGDFQAHRTMHCAPDLLRHPTLFWGASSPLFMAD